MVRRDDSNRVIKHGLGGVVARMAKLLVGATLITLALLVLDRLLLWMESRGWIYWRRNRPARGASTYHMLELHSNFDPGIQHLLEVAVKEEEEEDDFGEPPAA